MVLNAGPDVMRFAPSLVVEDADIEQDATFRPRGGEGGWGVNKTHQAKDVGCGVNAVSEGSLYYAFESRNLRLSQIP